MTRSFEELVFKNWSDRFQCSESKLKQCGTTLIPDEKYAHQNIIVLWHIGEHTFACFDPSYGEAMKSVMTQLPVSSAISGDMLQNMSGFNSLASHDIDLIHYLPAAALPNVTVPPPFNLRALSPSDAGALSALHSHCSPEEVDNGFVEVDHEIAFGCFRENELVSAASGYRMAGFMDIGVLTHPNFRKLGLGKVVVGALCAWAISQNIIVQYRCNLQNTGSLSVARALNFQQTCTCEVLMLPTLSGI